MSRAFDDLEDGIDIDAELAILDGESARDPALPGRPRTKRARASTPSAPQVERPAGVDSHPEASPKPAGYLDTWEPREFQAEVLDAIERYLTCVVHRRGGKTAVAVRYLKRRLEQATEPEPRVVFLGATLKSVKRNAWAMIKQTFGPSGKGKYVKRYNDADLLVELNNGGMLECLSATNFQSHRGTYLDGLVIDEVDLIPPSAFNSVFRPALVDRGGGCLFIGTPLGRGHLFDRFTNAEKSPNWRSWKLNVYDTGIIDDDELVDLQATMPEADWHREMMVDFDVPHPGAYYGKQMNEAGASHRLAELAHPLDDQVTAAWHLGKRDDVVVTLWHRSGDYLDCFDSIWEQRTSLGEIKAELERRDYNITRHVAPGDMAEVPGARIAQARAIGIKLRRAKKLEFMDRIYATKPILETCRFDVNRCADVIEGMRQYRAKYDELARTFEARPVDDWAVGFAGSVEAFCTDHNPRRSDWSKPFDYKNREREWRDGQSKAA